MSKVMLAIPVGIGVAAAIFAAVYFGTNEPESGDFTVSELVTLGSPYMGDESAPITIIEFGDYQCTYCYKFHKDRLGIIQKEYIDSGKASLVFVDFTLNGPDSVLAAEAAHCANEQGKFWPMHDVIYRSWKGERTGWVNRDAITQFAQAAEVDTASLNECLDSKKYHQEVLDTYEFAQGIEINATPSFLIISGDKITKITGNQPLEVFRKVLDGM
ncbi:DsbA family protein [Candidatus Nitrosotenuis cloacae]|uniref:DSBA oxidoreductase n=1 Tax=Candidatus Nitrosotenuis cloacae TaxID=1603555 RepID=A0A3G1B0D7_9ARCH|nr:thioredoxin domain-containing protein [Candidatus Nitrosotenuis cloacae]AJZ75305.1 DSBA oxidoreductase [Candidatus Nitrosotenuis cloacae]